MYPGVKSVTAIDEHRLIIDFDNGERRMFDVTPLLSIGRFRELASRQAFKTARVAFDTIEWENGLDLDPEYLYEHSETLPCEPAASAAGVAAAAQP
ncbi:MAG: DUF2442 domain-containing protein [Acidobacteriota bacterium]